VKKKEMKEEDLFNFLNLTHLPASFLISLKDLGASIAASRRRGSTIAISAIIFRKLGRSRKRLLLLVLCYRKDVSAEIQADFFQILHYIGLVLSRNVHNVQG